MKYNLYIQKLNKFLKVALKPILNYHLVPGYAFVSLPAISEIDLYKHAILNVMQLLEKGYLVTIIEQKEQMKCELCNKLKEICEEILEVQVTQMPLKEHVL